MGREAGKLPGGSRFPVAPVPFRDREDREPGQGTGSTGWLVPPGGQLGERTEGWRPVSRLLFPLRGIGKAGNREMGQAGRMLEMGAIAFRGSYHDPLGLTGRHSSRFPGDIHPMGAGRFGNRERVELIRKWPPRRYSGLASRFPVIPSLLGGRTDCFPRAMSGKETGGLACPAGLPGVAIDRPSPEASAPGDYLSEYTTRKMLNG